MRKPKNNHNSTNNVNHSKSANPNVFDYGNSLTQLQQINIPALHNLGYTGQGVTICVMDAGFNRLSHEVFSTMNIIAAYDFVNNDPGVGDSTDMGRGVMALRLSLLLADLSKVSLLVRHSVQIIFLQKQKIQTVKLLLKKTTGLLH